MNSCWERIEVRGFWDLIWLSRQLKTWDLGHSGFRPLRIQRLGGKKDSFGFWVRDLNGHGGARSLCQDMDNSMKCEASQLLQALGEKGYDAKKRRKCGPWQVQLGANIWGNELNDGSSSPSPGRATTLRQCRAREDFSKFNSQRVCRVLRPTLEERPEV